MKTNPKLLTENQKSVLTAYLALAKTLGVCPNRSDLSKAGVSRDRIRRHFGNMDGLHEYCREYHQKELEGVIDSRILSDDYRQELSDEVAAYKRFIITTVVGGGALHKGFYNSLQTYCKAKKAKLLLLRCEDPAAIRKFTIPKELDGEHIILEDTDLNNSVSLSAVKLSAKQIDPTTGLSRMGKRKGSFIFASAKQRLVFSAIRQHHLPHALMTTGAITLPNYESERYISQRTAYIATHDHVIGAVVVEIEDEEIFHFRQVQADKRGHFVDLGEFFQGDKITKMAPKEFVLGDWHSGSTDPTAKQAWIETVKHTKCEGLVLHDAFDGASINHHEKNKRIVRAIAAQKGKLDLAKEGRGLAEDLEELLQHVKRITIVKSNHDVFLDEILNDGRYINDPQNHRICSLLAVQAIDGKNPLKSLVEMTLTDKDLRKRITWLELDDSYVVAGNELGSHGHRGPKGSPGSLVNLEASIGDGVIGHSHTPGILRGMNQVGTSGPLDPPYGKGDPNSAFHSSCLVYPNGAKQNINSVQGKWRMR